MLRSLLAVAAGYISITIFNSFVRFILAVYKHTGFSVTGIAELSPSYLGYIFVAIGFLFGMIGGLLTCSIVNSKAKVELLALMILLTASGLFTYSFLAQSEPLWYLISAPVLKILGVFTAYHLRMKT